MSRPIDAAVLTDPSWWHWTATLPLLAFQLAGFPTAIYFAIALCALMAAAFALRLKGWRPYPAQIRIAYLVPLLLGLLPAMSWIHWLLLAGTVIMVTVGYCTLKRLLMLLPWNRHEPFTLALLYRAFIREPMAGGLLRVTSAPATCSCSLRQPDQCMAAAAQRV